jgi:ATP-dependent Zn protease
MSSAMTQTSDSPSAWVPPRPPAKKRRRMALFDRLRLIYVMLGVFALFVWHQRREVPVMTLWDAIITQVERRWWLVALLALEAARQVHYVVSERNAGWHGFWTERFFGAIDRWKDRRNPWTRYRVARASKFLVLYGLLGVLVAHSRHIGFLDGLAQVPDALWLFLTVGPKQVPFWVSISFSMVFVVAQFGFLFFFLSRGGVDVYMPDDIETRFSDVWGQDQVLAKVRENILFLENPRTIEEKGGHVPGGLLLWGPPGTGKTLMAEAVAGETGKPYVFVDPGAFINMFMGVGILKVKSLFRKLRKLALKHGGVIVFFDEADSLGNRGIMTGGMPGQAATDHDHLRWLSPDAQWTVLRAMASRRAASADEPPRRLRDRVMMGGMGGGGGMGTLQALLTELSGLKKPRGFLNRTVRRLLGLRPKPPLKYRMLIMMATNMPEALDEAMLRPGRIDRIYRVGYPSKEGRRRTYEGYLSKVSHELTPDEVDKLAVITPYATGATMKDLVNEALINAIRNGRGAVRWEDVIRAKHFKELGPSEDVEYIERERHAIAVHEACHAVAAYRSRRHMTIDLATIEKGGSYLGMVSSIKPEDQFTRWRTEYEADIIVSLASLAGERLFFGGDNSSGVSGDLEQATTVAALMEGFWGMGQTVASHAVSSRLQIGGGLAPRPGEKENERDPLDGHLGQRIEGNLHVLLGRAEQLLRDNYFEVLSVAHALETYKTLAGEDVIAVIEGTIGPLVDGRPYQWQNVRDELVAYHELAAAAHQAHGRVEATLPGLVMVPPRSIDATSFERRGDGPPPMPPSGDLGRP